MSNQLPPQRPELEAFREAMATFMATMPGLIWNYYMALKGQGFTTEQAFRLTRDWQLGTLGKPPQERDR